MGAWDLGKKRLENGENHDNLPSMDEVPQIEVLEPIVADSLALSSSANLSKKRIREEVISPTELVAVDIEGNGRGDWLTRKAGSRRRFWSLMTPRTRSRSMGQSLVMRRRDGGGFPMNHAEDVVHQEEESSKDMLVCCGWWWWWEWLSGE